MHWITSFYNANIQMIIDKDHNVIIYICAGQKPKQLLMHVQVAQPNYNTQLNIIIQQTQVHNIQTLTWNQTKARTKAYTSNNTHCQCRLGLKAHGPWPRDPPWNKLLKKQTRTKTHANAS